MTLTPHSSRVILGGALVLATALGLGACSSTSTTEGSGTSVASVASAALDSATRTIKDSQGTSVTVPAHPQKVVTLHFAATQASLDLGITPIGQGAYIPGLLPEDIEPEVIDIPVVRDSDSVNLEQIAALEPDLVLVPNMISAEDTAEIRKIAPAYVYTHSGADRADWQGRIEEISEALNLHDKFVALDDAVVARQEEIATEYADILADNTFAVINAYSPQEVGLNGSESMLGNLLTNAGVQWSAAEDHIVGGNEGAELTVSPEEVTRAVSDATVLLYASDLRAEPNEETASFMTTEVYTNLPAVVDGKDFPIGKLTIAGFTDAMYSLDQLEEILIGLREAA
ncbi:iron-siderophore ABC transporter, substrate-binding protein [Corynebacterium deserti GIMN1.010]|uniref:Iron-siderophore ABC transporter, substrate-binding protein n=1 Tax=Corynebacterium deserti GIMN1.010 TaxID=931089 RepID=A0A0M4CKA7_9CORY|nr:ABC transporter substrate-binding protein [Corynebacterium deserti]ALC04997.1 iron-siderophore ABC transporter, substrate-binding protein [Corynebacterium deserti GIMN1.010]